MEYDLNEENYLLGIEAGKANIKEAAKYFKKSFEAGNHHAMYTYAVMLLEINGEITSIVNFKKAVEALYLAADNGHENAKLCLAFGMFSGRIMKFDVGASLVLFEELCNAGNLQAMQHLATLYYEGYFVKKDFDKAFTLCQKVVNKEYKTSYDIHFCNYGYLGVTGTYSDELRFDQKFTTYHDENYFPHLLGMMYFNGEGVTQNYEKAFELFSLGKDQKQSIFMIGYMYEKGLYVEQDLKRAITNYATLEKYDNVYAKSRLKELNKELSNFEELYSSCSTETFEIEPLSNSYAPLSSVRNGNEEITFFFAEKLRVKGTNTFVGYPYSPQFSYDLLQKLTEIKNITAIADLGECLFFGEVFKKDIKEAIRIYSLVDESDFSETESEDAARIFYRLGSCYRDGKGVKQDLNEALRLTELSLKYPSSCYTYALNSKDEILNLLENK